MDRNPSSYDVLNIQLGSWDLISIVVAHIEDEWRNKKTEVRKWLIII